MGVVGGKVMETVPCMQLACRTDRCVETKSSNAVVPWVRVFKRRAVFVLTSEYQFEKKENGLVTLTFSDRPPLVPGCNTTSPRQVETYSLTPDVCLSQTPSTIAIPPESSS